MNKLMSISIRRLAIYVGLIVLAVLVTVSAFGTFVLTRQYDRDTQKRFRDQQISLHAGCERGNGLRRNLEDIANSVKTLDLYIAGQLRIAIRDPAPSVTAEQLQRARQQAKDLEALAEKVKAPKQQKCDELYPLPKGYEENTVTPTLTGT